MLNDAGEFPDLKAEVCVIGAGPAGLTLALELAGAGVRTIILESGGLNPSAKGRDLARGHSVGYPYHRLDASRVRAVGGTSRHWGGHWYARPLEATDFEPRAWLGVAGWPLSRSSLEPFYARAHELCGLTSLGDGYDSWGASPAPRLPEGLRPLSFQIGKGDFATFTSTIRENRNLHLALDATVGSLETDSDGQRVVSARVYTGTGKVLPAFADVFVLAAGGIENPRLLLLSNGHDPKGLGNGSGLVGRYFNDKLATWAATVRAEEKLLSLLPHFGIHEEGSVGLDGALALSSAEQRRLGVPNAFFSLLPRGGWFAHEGPRSAIALGRAVGQRPLDAVYISRHALEAVRHPRATLGYLASRFLGRIQEGAAAGAVMELGIHAEQVPNPESRITLGRRTDRHGLPGPVLDLQISPSDHRHAMRSTEAVTDALESTDYFRVVRRLGEESPVSAFIGHYHHCGTTRMSQNPADGVVDPAGRVHEVENTYVLGSSTFPTSGFANPTLTIVALGVRLARHLLQT